jgi:uracil-DNA glycosylase
VNERVAAVLAELQRLKREGVTALAVSDEALANLRGALQREAVAGGVDPGPTSPRPAAGTAPVSEVREASGASAAAAFRELMAAVEKPQTIRPRAASTPAAAQGATPADSGGLPPPPVVEIPAGTKRERWEWLRRRVLECPVCRAHVHGDFKVVFGVGNIDADIFFCGEAPGGEEEVQGEPFVGPAGQLLNKMIVAMGLQRETVYIGNILNWRPEMEGRVNRTSVYQIGNRPPTPGEMRFGLPYLRAQVEVVQPKVIVALGSTAAEGLLGFGSFKSLGEVRGRWHAFNGTPLMVTYHPSYLLRNASNRTKRMVWEDLLKVMERVGLPISEKQRGYFLG